MLRVRYILILLVVLGSLGQVASDIYLPSLPAITDEFNTSSNLVQLSIAIYMLCFALSQLCYGPLSDAMGRRKPIMLGLGMIILGSALCGFAQSIETLLIGRALQGMGGGSCPVLARALLRDFFSEKALAKFASYYSTALILIMTSAPLIGGYIHTYWGWRTNFYTLIGYGLLVLACFFFFLPETNKHRQSSGHWQAFTKGVRSLLSCHVFVTNSLSIFAIYGSVLAWLTVSPILLQTQFGISPIQFGWISLAMGACVSLGSALNAIFVNRWGSERMITLGVACLLGGAFSLLLLGLAGHFSLTVILSPVALGFLGEGIMVANLIAITLQPFEKIAGLASAIFGMMQMMGGFVVSALLSMAADNSQIPMGIAMCLCSSLLLIFQGYRRSKGAATCFTRVAPK